MSLSSLSEQPQPDPGSSGPASAWITCLPTGMDLEQSMDHLPDNRNPGAALEDATGHQAARGNPVDDEAAAIKPPKPTKLPKPPQPQTPPSLQSHQRPQSPQSPQHTQRPQSPKPPKTPKAPTKPPKPQSPQSPQAIKAPNVPNAPKPPKPPKPTTPPKPPTTLILTGSGGACGANYINCNRKKT